MARPRRQRPGPGFLAEGLPPDALRLEAPLEAMRVRGDGSYEIRFGGVASPVVADIVILALPFTTLRLVDLDDAGFGPSARPRSWASAWGWT